MEATVSTNRKYTLAAEKSTQRPGRLEEKMEVDHTPYHPIWTRSVLNTQLDKTVSFFWGENVMMVESTFNSTEMDRGETRELKLSVTLCLCKAVSLTINVSYF